MKLQNQASGGTHGKVLLTVQNTAEPYKKQPQEFAKPVNASVETA